jgi:hypothetical protein
VSQWSHSPQIGWVVVAAVAIDVVNHETVWYLLLAVLFTPHYYVLIQILTTYLDFDVTSRVYVPTNITAYITCASVVPDTTSHEATTLKLSRCK